MKKTKKETEQKKKKGIKDVNLVDHDDLEEDQELEKEEGIEDPDLSENVDNDFVENAKMISMKCHHFITQNILDEESQEKSVSNMTALLSSAIYHLMNIVGPEDAAGILNMSYTIGQRVFLENLRNRYVIYDKKKLH